MIIATFTTNIRTNEIAARTYTQLPTEKIEHLILDFISSVETKAGTIYKEWYKYAYMFAHNTYYVLVVPKGYPEMRSTDILSFISSNSTSDPMDILVTIDNTIFGDTIVYPQMGAIKSLDSQEEKIYNIMMKNREEEVKKKQREILKSKSSGGPTTASCGLKAREEIYKKLDDVHHKEMEIVKQNVQDLHITTTKKPKSSAIKKKFEVSDSNVFVCLKEKINASIDAENNIKLADVQGELFLNVKNEVYKNIEILFKGKGDSCKFSPKIDREGIRNGIIRSESGFPLDKNLALVKWKISSVDKLPLSFSFWPSEVSRGKYQFGFVVQADKDLQDVSVIIPANKIQDVEIDGDAIYDGNEIKWSKNELKSGEDDDFEISCACDEPSDLFPISVQFTAKDLYVDLNIDRVVCGNEDVDELEIKNICEAGDFVLHYE